MVYYLYYFGCKDTKNFSYTQARGGADTNNLHNVSNFTHKRRGDKERDIEIGVR